MPAKSVGLERTSLLSPTCSFSCRFFNLSLSLKAMCFVFLCGCLVCLFHGGVVKKNEKFEDIKEVTKMFEVITTLQEIVDGPRSNFRCGRDTKIMLTGRVDCARGGISNFALMNLTSELN